MNPFKFSNFDLIDSYKDSHYLQYRPGTTHVSSYIEARGVQGHTWKDMVVAGLPYLMATYLDYPFIQDMNDITAAEIHAHAHGDPFNREGFEYILSEHGGYLPLRIQALPEGSVIPLGTPFVQVTNTDPKAFFATSYIETHILREIWYPTTVATLSFHIKRIIADYMMQTAGHTDGIDFKLHDFGPRGVSSSESSAKGGLAHLYSFQGSDNKEATKLGMNLLGHFFSSFSIPAAEHSTITSWGGPEYEVDAFRHMLTTFGKPNAIFAVVSDTYNIWNAVDNLWGGVLKEEVIALGNINAKLVVRPDSGDPVITPVEVIERLMNKFGYTTNKMGYKELPPYIGVIQGDGINETSIRQILQLMKMKGLSATNINFGMGGALLQQVNRDTLKFAMKASAIKNPFFGNDWHGIRKEPITDKGKVSKLGRQAVVLDDGKYYTVPEKRIDMYGGEDANLLQNIYYNGPHYDEPTLEGIRARINEAL